MARLTPLHVALVLVLATATAQYSEDESSEEATSKDCPKEAARFRPLRKYTYNYEAEVGSGVEGAAPNRAGFRLQCKVELEVPERCAFVLRLKDCALHEATSMGPDGRPIYSAIRGSDLQQSLSRYELGFRTAYGSVSTLFPHSDEPEAALNVKRGIVAALMPPPMDESDRSSRVLTSVHGGCPTEVTVTARKGVVPSEVTLTRDLRSCNTPVGKGATSSPLALISGLTTFATSLFASTQECAYSLDSRRKAVSEVTCTERHMFLPFSNKGKSGAVSTVKQTLKMTDQAKSNIRNFDVNEKNARDLTYEPQATEAVAEDPQRVLSTLTEMVELGAGADNRRQAELFASLLASMRALSNDSLFEILPRLLELSSSITLQSLPQCGTAPCYSALLQLVRSSRVPPALSGVVAYTLGFHPAPCTMVVRDTLTLAQAAPTRASMLALSMVVHRHFTTHKQVGKELQDVAAFMQSQLGGDCSGDEDKTYLALKAAGNMGGALQAADGAVAETLAACVGNARLPLPVQLAAIQALRRTQLTESTRASLLSAYRDPRAPVQRRIAAYLALMAQPEPAQLWDVLSSLPREENKQLRSYVASHIDALRSNNGPVALALREKLEHVISGIELPAAYSYNSLKYSHRMEASRVVTLPGATQPLAGAVRLDVIMEPSGFLPRSVLLETSLDVLGESLDVFEIGVDGQGFEAPLEALFGPKGFFPNSAMNAAFWVDGKLPEQLAAVVRKWTGVNPGQRKQNVDLPKEMMGTMQRLMQEVNLQKLPMEASAFLRVMGTELGYVRHSDIKMLIGAAAMAGRGLQALPKQILSALAGGVEADLFAHYVFMDNDVTVPTGAGLPLRLASTGSLVAGAKVKAMMRPGEANRASAAPSLSVEVVSSMEVLLPGGVARAGLLSATSLYHESALGLAVRAADGELRVTLTPPQKTNRLLSVGNQLRLLHRRGVEVLPSIEENREQWQSCRPLVFGVSLCQSGAYSNASFVDAAPWFPLTGATSFEISTEPADGVNEYTAVAAVSSQAGRDNLQFRVQATGTSETRELGSILMLDRDRHRIRWDLDLPNCPRCLVLEMAVDDESDARLNQGGYVASVNVTNDGFRLAYALTRIRQTVTDTRSLLAELSAGIPVLRQKINTVARATLGQDDRIVLSFETTGTVPYSSAAYTTEVTYDLDKVQAQSSAMAWFDPKEAYEDIHGALASMDVPSLDDYRVELQGTLNAMLEGRVAQTDMTLRHIVVKTLEAMDLWMKKSTNGNWNFPQLSNLQTQLSRGQEIVLPSIGQSIYNELPIKFYVSSSVTTAYQFNKQAWTLEIPMPMGGQIVNPVTLLPRTVRTPRVRIDPLGIDLLPRQFTVQPLYVPGIGKVESTPAFRIPEKLTLRVPLFGELSLDAWLKSNLYNWTANVKVANATNSGDGTYLIETRSRSNAACTCSMLSYDFTGYTALSQRDWNQFEVRADNTIHTRLLNLTSVYKSTADISEGLGVNTEIATRVAMGLLSTSTNLITSVTLDGARSSFTSELIASTELPRGARAKLATTASGTVSHETLEHLLNGDLAVDLDAHALKATWRSGYAGQRYSLAVSNELSLGGAVASRNRVGLRLAAPGGELTVRNELAFREENVTNELTVTLGGGSFRAQESLRGRLLGSVFLHASSLVAGDGQASFSGQTDGLFRGAGASSKVDASYGDGALRLSLENKADYGRARFAQALSAGITSAGLDAVAETSLASAPDRATNKASLVVDAAGVRSSANTVVLYGPVMMENTVEGGVGASGVRVTVGTVGRAEGDKAQHSAEGRLDGSGLALVSTYAGQILETDSSSTLNLEVNGAGLSFVTKTVASYAENKVDHGCNLKIAPWSVDLTAVDELKLLGATFSNQVAAKAGPLTASVSGSASGRLSDYEVRHSYKLGYADLAGSASVDTVADLNGRKLRNQLSAEFAGLSAKVVASTTCDTRAVKFSNTVRGAALPYRLSLEAVTESQGSLEAFGVHAGSLSNKMFVQAEPLALALSNEYRGSTQHDVALGRHVSALRHKLSARANPAEQGATWELTAELDDNRYAEKLELQNDPLSAVAKFEATSTVNLGFLDVDVRTPAVSMKYTGIELPALSGNLARGLGLDASVLATPQDLVVQASVTYDKNQDVHVISVPFLENLPEYYERLRVYATRLLEAVRSSLSRRDIQRYYQQYQRMLDELPGRINDAIEELELKSKLKHLQGQLVLAIQNYDPRDLSTEEMVASVRDFSRTVVEWVSSVLFYPISGMNSEKMRETIDAYSEQIVEKVTGAVEYLLNALRVQEMMQNAKEALLQAVKNYRISENLSVIRDTLLDLDSQLQVREKIQKLVSDLKAVDVKGYLEQLSQFVVSLSKKLASMDYPAFVDRLNELLQAAFEHLRGFDYGRFVADANTWLQQQAATFNDKLREFNVPERVEQLRERVNTVARDLSLQVQAFSMRDVHVYVAECVDALLEIPAVRRVSDRLVELVENARRALDETDVRDQVQKLWKEATASVSHAARAVAQFDVNKAVSDAVEQLQALAAEIDLQETARKIVRFLEEGVIVPRFKVFGHTFPKTEVSLRALRRLRIPTDFYTPEFYVPFTRLFVPSIYIDLKTLSSLEIPTRVTVPSFSVLGVYQVDSVTVDLQEIKLEIIEFLDMIRNVDVASIYRSAWESTGELADLTLNDIPFDRYLVLPEFRFPDFQLPEFNLPQLNLDDINFIEMADFRLPRIPYEAEVPALGKLNANLKVTSPFYTLTATAGLHNSTEAFGSPSLRSFANAQLVSPSGFMDFTLTTEARLSAPRLESLELNANGKLTSGRCTLTHSSDVTVGRAGVTGQFKSQAAADLPVYSGEASSLVTLELNRALAWEATGIYRHRCSFAALNTGGVMNVQGTAKVAAQDATLEAGVAMLGDASGWLFGKAHEGTHKAEAGLRVGGAVLLLTAKIDSAEKFGSLKHEASLEVAPFDRVVYTHSGDTAVTGVGRSNLQVTARLQGLQLDASLQHSAVGTKLVAGKMMSATTLHAEPFQLTFVSNTTGGGKLQLPLRLSAKVEAVNNLAVSLTAAAQHADWTFGGEFNSYRYRHDASVDNDADRIAARASVGGNANLEFLRRDVSLPSMALPYAGYRTPEVRNFNIWERTGLGALLRTPQQTLNASVQLQYAKSKESHELYLPFLPALHRASENWNRAANAAFERHRDAALQWVRDSYGDARALGADDVPKRVTVPRFTVPLLNLDVSSYTVELPDVSILVARSYSTPAFDVPVVGYSVPSYELSLPKLNLPPMKIPGALRRLSLPEISLSALPHAVYVPAMGNLTYDFTFRCPSASVSVHSGVYNQGDVVAKLSASSASEHAVLNGELSAAATLSRKRGVKLSTALALNHRAAQVSHSGIAVANKRVGEVVADTTARIDASFLRVDFRQSVNASTRLRPHVRVQHSLSYKATAPAGGSALSGKLEHNATAEAAWLSLSLDSHFAGVSRYERGRDESLSAKLDNAANLYVDQRGVRSALRNEAQSKSAFESGVGWDVSGKQEADLELSPLRFYAVAKHVGRNQFRGGRDFTTQGAQSAECRLEFAQWELKGLAKGELSQPSSLTPKAGAKQSASLSVSAERQQAAWSGEAQLASAAYSHEASASNERERARYAVDASLRGHASFLKQIVLPVYGRSLWDVLKMDVTTKGRDVQVVRASSSAEYTKNPDGYTIALPVLAEGNGYRVSIPEMRLRVPDFVRQIPALAQTALAKLADREYTGPPRIVTIPVFRVPLIDMVLGPYEIDIDNLGALFDFPEEFTVPAFRVPVFDVYVPAYTVRLWDIALPSVFVTPAFRVPLTSIEVPSYRVDLRDVQLPKLLRVPSFSLDLPSLPRIPLPQLDVTLEYVTMREDYTVPFFQLTVPAFRLSVPSFTLPKEIVVPAFSLFGHDFPRYVFRFDDASTYLANFELPTVTLPAVTVEIPTVRLSLPTAVTLPAFGNLVGGAKVQSPVYNLTCKYSSFGGDDPDALLVVDATASSTLRFLEFDVDVKSKVSPKEDGSEIRMQASLSHPELTVEILETLAFSPNDPSGTYEATIDLLSPSLTDMSMRLSYANARAHISMSSPSLGFLGFVAERQNPQVLSAQLYARETVAPESDVQLALLTLSLNTPDILGVESHWKGGMARDAANIVRRSAPRAARSLYGVVDKYHKEHLGLTLEEFPSRAEESLEASVANLRAGLVRAQRSLARLAERLSGLVAELADGLGRLAEQTHRNLLTAIGDLQRSVRPQLLALAERTTDLRQRMDAGLKDGYRQAEEVLRVFAALLKETRIGFAGVNEEYSLERIVAAAFHGVSEIRRALVESAYDVYQMLRNFLSELEFSSPFTDVVVSGTTLVAEFERIVRNAAAAVDRPLDMLYAEGTYRDALDWLSVQADVARRAYLSAVTYDYARAASGLAARLRYADWHRELRAALQQLVASLAEAADLALNALGEGYYSAVDAARVVRREYLDSTALGLSLKYWEVEDRVAVLVKTVLDYFREMGPKYYEDGAALVQKLSAELGELSRGVNLDRPEKVGAKVMELSAQAKRRVQAFVVAATARIGEASAGAGDRAARLSSTARVRFQEAYARFSESYDGLFEQASRALDSSMERYAGIARSLVEFLRRLPGMVSGALARYAEARPGGLSLRLPQGVVSWRSFDELPRLKDNAVSSINSTVAIGRQIINERLAQTRALISANIATLDRTMADAIPKLYRGVDEAKMIVNNALWFMMDPMYYVSVPMLDELPPFKASAMVFADGDYMVTFDGRVIETPQLPGGRCAFLLAHDFLDQNFTLVKMQGYIALRLPSTVLYITSAGAMSVDTPSNKVNIPYSDAAAGVSVTRNGDFLLVETNAGVSVRVDTARRTFFFEISGFYHGRTMGLLGTNDHEPATDMTISNGYQASDIAAFFSSWEMTGASDCANVRVVPVSRRQLSSPRCKHLLDKMNSSSPFNPCFNELDPSEFLSLCQKGSDICPTSTAYLNLCEQKGIFLSGPDDCVRCNRKKLKELWTLSGAANADVLFVVEQSSRLQHAKVKGLLQAVDESLSKQGIKDARYGLVTFGGEERNGKAQMNAVRGEVWTSAANMKRALPGLAFTGDSGTPAYHALAVAASYEFQPEAARIVVLVTAYDQPASFLSSIDLPDIDYRFKSNGIVLSVLSDYRVLRKSSSAKSALVGLTGDGQPILSKGSWADGEAVPVPRGDYVKLVRSTNGAVFSVDALRTDGDATAAGQAIAGYAARNVAQRKECMCVYNEQGRGKVQCHYV